MRPSLLVLENVGPFHGPKTVIDFDRLDRLFLVGGDTGAGKTTIFDAMCFALYGRPLGTRDGSSLRSQRANDDEPTSVELVFSLRDKRYKVRRTPEFQRRKKRGEGTTKADATVEFYREEGSVFVPVPGKPSVVDATIAETIGLSYENFARILVLPQGEFQQFLEMNSKARGELLERLFPVEKHRAMIVAAKDEAKRVADELQKHAAVLDGLVERGFDPSRLDETRRALAEAFEVASAASRNADEAWQRATEERAVARQLLERFAELDAAEALRATCEAQSDAIGAKRAAVEASRRARRVDEARVRRDESRRRLEQSQAREVELGAKRADLAAREASFAPSREALEGHRTVLRALAEERAARETRITDLRAIEALGRELEKLAAGQAKATEDLDQARLRRTDLEAKRAALEAKRTVFDGLVAERDRLATRSRALESVVACAQFLRGATERLAAIDADLTGSRAALAEAALGLDAANEALAHAEAAIHRDVAASVALGLADGEPCPVCGSVEHPSPARRGDARELLERTKREAGARVETSRKLVAQIEKTITAHETRRAEQTSRLEAETRRLVEAGFESVATYDAARERLEAETAENTRAGRALRDELAELPKLARASEETRALVERFEEEARASASRASEIRGRLGGHAERLGGVAEAEVRGVLAAELAAEADAETKRVALETEVARIERTEAALAGERAALDKASVALAATLDAEVASLDRDREALEACVREQGFPDESAAVVSLREPALDADDARAIDEHDKAVLRVEEQLARLRPALEDVPRPDPETLEKRELETKLARSEAAEQLAQAKRAVESFEENARNYLQVRAEKDAFEARSKAYLALARDLSGDNPAKIDFAKFALERFLESVLEQASSRLLRLTNDRYSFELDSTVDDARSGAGLDIDVRDAHSGLRRDVKTLSGGEKFMAALSLALGLSDVIEARAGGIALDALFVDEGFGSLDAEALDRALSVLDEVGVSRMVGVISHVEAMRTAIPSQLRVERRADGSRVTLV